MARAEPLPPDVVPVREVPWEDEAGRIVLRVPRFGNDFLGRVLRRFFTERPSRVKLDALGSFAWRSMDGNACLSEIAEALDAAFGEEKGTDAPARLEAFLRTLHRYGWITFRRKVDT